MYFLCKDSSEHLLNNTLCILYFISFYLLLFFYDSVYNHSCFLLFLLGGLSAVIWTDFIQTILMIIGAILLAILGRYINNLKS